MNAFFWFPGGIFGLIVPIFLIFIGVRILRRIFFSASERIEDEYYRDSSRRRIPLDDYSTVSRYPAKQPPAAEPRIFRLANKMKGRLTVSDVVIETNMSLKEVEELLDGMVDGIHVTMEVRDNGSVVYEFPEIIARYERGDDAAH